MPTIHDDDARHEPRGSGVPRLDRVLIGGEVVPTYGATETTNWSTMGQVTRMREREQREATRRTLREQRGGEPSG